MRTRMRVIKKINELSKDTLKSYIKGASRQATIHSEIAGNYRETADKIRDLPGSKHFVKFNTDQANSSQKIADKRTKGITKAADKLTK